MLTPHYLYEQIKSLTPHPSAPKKATFAVERANRLAATVLSVLSNMDICNRFLNEINDLMSADFQDIAPFTPKRYRTMHATTLPDPEETELNQAADLLTKFEHILLANEQRHGINIGLSIHTVPEFISQIPGDRADAVKWADCLWNDYNGDLTGFAHGRYSHRIQYYILLRALDESCVDTTLLVDYIDFSDLTKLGAFLKFLIPSATQHDFMFRRSEVSIQRRSHWHIAMEDDAFRPWNTLTFLPIDTVDGPRHLAGPTKISTHLLSPISFSDRPLLAQAMYHSCFLFLRQVAAKQGQPTLRTFMQILVVFELETPALDTSLIKAVNKTMLDHVSQFDTPPILKPGAPPAYILHEPVRQQPSVQHAMEEHASAIALIKDNQFDIAANKLHQASIEFQRLSNVEGAATSSYCEATAYKRQGNMQAAQANYGIAYQLRESFFGKKHPTTEKAKKARDENETESKSKQTNLF